MSNSSLIEFLNVQLLKRYLEARRFDYQLPQGQRTAYFSVRDVDAGLQVGKYDHRYVSIESDDFFSAIYVRSTTPSPQKPAPWRLHSPKHSHQGCVLTEDAFLFFTAEKGRITPTPKLRAQAGAQSAWQDRISSIAKSGKFCIEPSTDYSEQTVVCSSAREI